MKINLALLSLYLSLGATSLFADDNNANAVPASNTNFQIGQSSFPLSDSIEITSVERSADRIVVKGHYKLVSAESADLSLYTTTPTAVAVPTDKTQSMRISKGEGDFELIDPNVVPGLNHVSMYSVPGGNPFGGVYFGNAEEAVAEGKMDLDYYKDASAADAIPRNGQGALMVTSGPNQVLLEFLGNPVEPPANMDARYTKEGLMAAIQSAAKDAGITIKKGAVDDSEYPFLVGVACAGSDFAKLKAQIRKMDGYAYSGSIGNDDNKDGSDTCNVFNIVPYSAFPREDQEHIDHRLMLRQQVFYDRLNAEK